MRLPILPHPIRFAWTVALLFVTGLGGFSRTARAVDASPPQLQGFDATMQQLVRDWNVPGIGVGVVVRHQLVFARGYGYRDYGRKLPFTEHTVVPIASNTKLFTAVAAGLLVEEGKLEWDQPIRQFVPSIEFHDDELNRAVSIRDMLSHRTGITRHDLIWYKSEFTRPELFERLKYLEPSASFRSRWQYQNLMFLTAGYLVERRTGRSWDDLIRERVFAPLEMTRSNTSVRDLPAADDAALGYVWRDCPAEKAAGMVGTAGAAGAAGPSSKCGLVQVPYRNIDAVAPAGSINSDVEEMLHYIQFHIDSGRYNGRAILSKENAGLMETPQMLVGDQEIWPDELGVATYGLGLSVTSYRGRKLVQHGGGIDGFISQMSWLPRERIGIMVVTNMSGTNPVPNIVTRNVIDRLLGLAPIDWVARTEKQLQDAKAKRLKQRADRAAERQPNTSPSHPLSAYGGTYEHPAYGRLSVQADGAALSLSFDGFNVPLKHFHYDVFEIDDPMDALPLSGRVTFLMDSKGNIDRMAVPFEPSVKDIEFTRVKNP